jgi:hypothetical protein
VPNGLIALIVVVLLLVIFGVFTIVRFGPPKDARRKQVTNAVAGQIRAERAIDDIDVVLDDAPPLDIVGDELRRKIKQVIRDYETRERELKQR